MSFRIIFLFMFVSILGYGQTSYIKKTADDFYKKESYLNAIEFYEKLLLNNKADVSSLQNLATAYLRTRQTDKAEKIGYKLIESGVKTEENLYQYAYTLATNGKYELAKNYFQQVLTLNPNNTRAVKFFDGYCNLSNYFSDTSNYKFYYTLFNSPHSDFSPLVYNNKLVFVSSRTTSIGVQRVFEYNNTPFLDLYSLDTTDVKKSLVKNVLVQTPATENLKNKNNTARETSNDTKTSIHLSSTLHSDSLKKLDKKYNVQLFSKDLSSAYHEGPSVFSADNKVLYFTGNNFKVKNKSGKIKPLSIYMTTDNGKGGFKKPVELPFSNDNYSIAHPAISSDGTTLYFSSDMPNGAGGMDLYKCSKSDKGWETPINLEKINTPGDEVFPFIFNDELLFYSSNGNGGLGGLDIFYTSLNDFSKGVNPGFPINSSKDDFGVFVYENGKSGYISSNRSKNGSDDDIYYFDALNKFELNKDQSTTENSKITFRGSLKNKMDSTAIVTMVALFYQSEDNLVELNNTDDKGNFSFQLNQNTNYILKIADSDYYIVTDSFSTEKNNSDITKIYLLEKNIPVVNVDSIRKIMHSHISKITFYGKIFDSIDHKPLESTVKITNNTDSSFCDLISTDKEGSFSFSLSRVGNYTINILSKDYKMYFSSIDIPDSQLVHKKFYLTRITSDYDSLLKIWVPMKEKGLIKGKIISQPGNVPLSDLIVLFQEGDTLQEDFTVSGFDGEFEFKIQKNIKYNLFVMDKELGELNAEILLPKTDSVIERTIVFKTKQDTPINLDSITNSYALKDSLYNITYSSILLDSITKEPIDAMVAIHHEYEGEPDEVTVSDFEGKFDFKIRKGDTLFVKFKSKGYNTKSIIINSKIADTIPSHIYMSKSKETLLVDSALATNRKKLDKNVMLFGRISSLADNQPMISLIAIYDQVGEEPLFVLPSDENGFFSCKLEHSHTYRTEILEIGFLPYKEYLVINDSILVLNQEFKIKKPIKENVYKEINEKLAEQVSHIEENKKLIEENYNQDNIIKGYIFEKETYIPISARVILINSNDGRIIKDTVASMKGEFQFLVTEQVPYKILVEKEGYYTDTFLNRKNTFNKSQLILFLNRIPHYKKIIKNIPLVPVVFSGKVIDAVSLTPSKGIMGLYILPKNELSDVVYTDMNGNFSTLLIPEKKYIVKIAYSGYSLISDTLSAKTSLYRDYYLVKNYQPKSIDSIKQSWSSHLSKNLLNGTISDKLSKEPLDAIIKITSLEDTNQYFITMSDFDGLFSQNVYKEGKYNLEILCKGYKTYYSIGKVSSSNTIYPTEILMEKINPEFDSLQLSWSNKIKGTIRGTVFQHPSIPLSSFVILLSEKDSILHNYTIADIDGNYSLPIKKGITYTLLVQDASNGDKVSKVMLDKNDSLLIHNIVFHPDSAHQTYNFDSLARTYRQQKTLLYRQLESIVIDSKTAKPIKAAVIVRSSPKSEPEEVMITDAEGEICLQVRNNTIWYLSIESEGYQTKEILLTPTTLLNEKILMYRNKENLLVDSLYTLMAEKLRSKVILKGLVLNQSDDEPLMAFVALYENDKTEPLDIRPADIDGAFSFTLERNKSYRIEAVDHGYIPFVQALNTFDSTNLVYKLIKLVASETIPQNDSLISFWKNNESNLSTFIYGALYDSNNNPVMAEILVMDKDMSQILEHSFSDHMGRYSVSIPSKDQYLIKLTAGYLKLDEFIYNKEQLKIINKNFYFGKQKSIVVTKENSSVANNSVPKTYKNKIAPSTSQKKQPTGIISIVFGVNRNSIHPTQYIRINTLKKILQEDTSVYIDIIGHADNTGSEVLNQKLSQNRADAVKRHLVSQKIAPTRLNSYGKGENIPIVSNTTIIGRSVNRRVDYKLYKKGNDTIIPIIYSSWAVVEYNLIANKWVQKRATNELKEIIALLKSDSTLQIAFHLSSAKESSNEAVFNIMESSIEKANSSYKNRIHLHSIVDKIEQRKVKGEIYFYW